MANIINNDVLGQLAAKKKAANVAPVSTPSVSTPSTFSSTPSITAKPTAMTAPGVPSTKVAATTPKVTPAPTAPIRVTAPKYNEASATNYGGTGNSLNEILFSKKQYDAGNKTWAANNAQQYYSQLDPAESALVKGMNTQQLIDYINSKNTPSTPVPTAPINENAANGVAFSGNTNPTYQNFGQYVPGNEAAPPSWVTAEEETYLKNQLASLQGLQSTYTGQLNSALDQNKQYIAQQLDSAQQMQNRRGGLYSGGYDYQAGTLNAEGLQRQSELQNQYGNQISSIAQQINNLNQAQPEILRQRIQEYINNDRNYALNYAGTFGNLGGVNTQSMQGQLFNQDMTNQQFDWQKQMDTANLTGMYNGQSTLAGKTFNRDTAWGYGDRAQQILSPQQDPTGYLRQINQGVTSSGTPIQQTYDAANTDRNYNYQVGRDAVADAQWQKQFEEDVKQNGLAYALQKNAQVFSQNNANADNSRANASASFGRLMDIWQATGSAPAGITGVAEGTPYGKQTSSGSQGSADTKIDSKVSADNYNMLLNDLGSPGIKKEEALQLIQLNSPYLTDSDYRKLYDWVDENMQ